MTLIETIDKVRELRAEADKLIEDISYDPVDYQRGCADRINTEADALEYDMHRQLGWDGSRAATAAKKAHEHREHWDNKALNRP